MVRPLVLLAGLAVGIALAAAGCQSCSSCHDYDAPVANCDCNACGTHRAGSNSGYVSGEYAPGEYVEEEQVINGEANGGGMQELNATE